MTIKLTTNNGFHRTRQAANIVSKHGVTSLAIPGHDPPLDITVHLDIAKNPGPTLFLPDDNNLNFRAGLHSTCNLHTFVNQRCGSVISYSRCQLFDLRSNTYTLSDSTIQTLKEHNIL